MTIFTTITGRIVSAAFAAAVMIGAPLAAVAVAPAAQAEDIFIPNLDGLCPNGLPDDCDGDGFSDADEKAAGLDPLTPNELNIPDLDFTPDLEDLFPWNWKF